MTDTVNSPSTDHSDDVFSETNQYASLAVDEWAAAEPATKALADGYFDYHAREVVHHYGNVTRACLEERTRLESVVDPSTVHFELIASSKRIRSLIKDVVRFALV